MTLWCYEGGFWRSQEVSSGPSHGHLGKGFAFLESSQLCLKVFLSLRPAWEGGRLNHFPESKTASKQLLEVYTEGCFVISYISTLSSWVWKESFNKSRQTDDCFSCFLA